MTRPDPTNHQAANSGGFFVPEGGVVKIQTFKQWDDAKRRALAGKYEVTLAELRQVYKPNHFRPDWWAETVKAYESGAAFTTTQWNKLTDQQQWQILRTSRALRMSSSVHYPWKVAATHKETP